MMPSDRDAQRVGRRTLLRGGLTAALALLVDRAHAGPWRPPTAPRSPAAAQPPPPARPGAPPDKQGSSGVTVRTDDPSITTAAVEYSGVVGTLLGYVATPRGSDVYPGVLVLHDVQGLTEHFKDIARRLAKAGFVALVPDIVSRAGGTEKLGDAAKVTAAFQAMGAGQILQDLNASVRYLEAQPLAAKTRIGALGFGAGGAAIWLVAANNADIKAAVSVSGTIPSDRAVSGLKAAVLSIYGENDRRDQDAINDFDTAMKKAGLSFTLKLEPKAGHDFFNDTTARYVPDAAKDAWAMTLDWFAQHLKG